MVAHDYFSPTMCGTAASLHLEKKNKNNYIYLNEKEAQIKTLKTLLHTTILSCHVSCKLQYKFLPVMLQVFKISNPARRGLPNYMHIYVQNI